MVVSRIMLPHEFVYMVGGQLTVHEQLPLPLFVSEYFAVLEMVKMGLKEVKVKHLRELMSDAVIYDHVHTYHMVWFQQMENRWVERMMLNTNWSCTGISCGTPSSWVMPDLSPLLIPGRFCWRKIYVEEAKC